MTETELKELNERLLKAVFPDAIDIFPGAFELSGKTLVQLKDEPLIELRLFTVSMDSCLEWIVPVLKERGIFEIEFNYDGELNCTLTRLMMPMLFKATATTETVAFCLAADKFLSERK
jgi:hypothetical protein